MKLFLFRLLWVAAIATDIIGALVTAAVGAVINGLLTFFRELIQFPYSSFPQPELEDVEEDTLYLECEAFFDRESTPLDPAPFVGNDVVLVGEEKVVVNVVQVATGYSVYSIANAAVSGFGCTVTAAKYDFYCAYKRFKDVRSLIAGYYEQRG
jgi:hypothetical protein